MKGSEYVGEAVSNPLCVPRGGVQSKSGRRCQTDFVYQWEGLEKKVPRRGDSEQAGKAVSNRLCVLMGGAREKGAPKGGFRASRGGGVSTNGEG